MNPAHVAVVISIAVFAGILVCLEVGYRVGLRGNAKHPQSAHEGIGVNEAAVFALLGLLLGFSFAGGTSRLESKRQLIDPTQNSARLLLPALNEMIDVTTARRIAIYTQLPLFIFLLLT